jgi:hypothetical protein
MLLQITQPCRLGGLRRARARALEALTGPRSATGLSGCLAILKFSQLENNLT